MEGVDVYLEIEHAVCPLCLYYIEDNDSTELGCQHNFCKSCIADWLGRHCVCPLCSYNVNGQIDIVHNIDEIGVDDIDLVYDGVYDLYPHYDIPSKTLVYGVTYNILKIMRGGGGLAYQY